MEKSSNVSTQTDQVPAVMWLYWLHLHWYRCNTQTSDVRQLWKSQERLSTNWKQLYETLTEICDLLRTTPISHNVMGLVKGHGLRCLQPHPSGYPVTLNRCQYHIWNTTVHATGTSTTKPCDEHFPEHQAQLRHICPTAKTRNLSG